MNHAFHYSKYPPPLERPNMPKKYGYKKKSNYNPLSQSLKNAAAYAAQRGLQYMLSSNSTRTREGPSSAITTQKDSMSLYKRRRAPRKVRNRARKRYKNFLSRQLRAKNDNTNLFQDDFTFASAANMQQMNTITFGYLGASAASTDKVGEWQDAMQNQLNADPNLTSLDWYVTGLTYDITISNSTALDTPANAVAVELDVYEYVFRKDYNVDQISIANELVESLGKETQMPGALNRMDFDDVGVVPTDANQFMRYIIIKSKQRYYIPIGDSVSFVKRINYKRPYKLTSDDFDELDDSETIAKSGLTRGLILIQKGTVAQNAVNSIGITELRINVQSRYKFKSIDRNPNANARGT